MATENQTVDPQTLEFRRAVKDSKQAHQICKRIIQDNDQRSTKDAAIQRKLNGEQPWSDSQLKAAGQGWRSNRSTDFLASVVHEVCPNFIKAIDSAMVLTSSALKGTGPDSEKKSKAFQVETTKTMRRWSGWKSFCDLLCLENVVFGRGASVCTDEVGWTPTVARSDEIFFPDGCPQTAKDVPLFVYKQNFQIHELATKLGTPKISQAVGWNLENVVKAINDAQPENRSANTQENQRKYEDLYRETGLGASYSQGVKVVETFHLFVQEANGKVSQYLVDQKNGDELMTRHDRYSDMQECLALFTLDIGNGKLYGSKGIGRLLYNTHVAVEQLRNLIVDNLYLSGLVLLKATQKGKDASTCTVAHPFVVLGDNFEVIDHQFKADAQSYFQLDQNMTSLAKMQVGAYTPQLPMKGDVKASQVNYLASVEMQIKEGVLGRFWGQFMLLVGQMQRRIYSADNIAAAYAIFQQKNQGAVMKVTRKLYNFMAKIGRSVLKLEPQPDEVVDTNKDAVEACLNLLAQGLTPEELFELGQANPSQVMEESPQQTAAATDAVTARYLNNPLIKQLNLIRRDIASKLGYGVADDLVIPQEDNTIKSEAMRMQLLEMPSLLQGNPVPVSPRDNHLIHMSVIEENSKNLLQGITPQTITKEMLAIVKNLLSHYDQHLQGAKMTMKPEQLQAQAMFSQQAHAVFDKIAGAGGPQAPSPARIPQGAVPLHAALNEPLASHAPMEAATPAPSRPMPKPNALLSHGPVNLNPKVTP